jgi:arabinogalactan oligomer/maltooligosaccharide transport system permease protein
MNKNRAISGMAPSTKVLMSVFLYAWLVITVLVTLIPLAWMVWASLSKGKLLTGVTLWPDAAHFSLEHYTYLFTYASNTKEGTLPDFVAAFGRTLVVALLNVGVVTLLSVMAGYAVSRFKFAGKKTVMYGMLILQLFPAFMGMVAIQVMFRDFGWLRNANYFVMVYTAGMVPMNIFMLRGYMNSIPRSLDEAAMIDGATRTKTFLRILLPLTMPMIGFIAVNAFMAPWMDFILPSVFLDKKSETIAVLLYRWTDPLTTLTYNPLNFMAGGLLLGLPIMLVQFYMQKYVVYGMTSGADKG